MERTFLPEISVGHFQMSLIDGAAHDLATAWAAAYPALGISSNQYVLLIDVEGNNVRYKDTGDVPTAALGGRIIKDTQLVYTAAVASRANLQFIAETAANCKVNITIYKHVV